MKIHTINRLSWLAAIMLFLFIPPYFMWGVFSRNAIKIVFTIVLCAVFYCFRSGDETGDRRLKFLFTGTLLYYILIGVINGQSNFSGVIARLTMLLYVAIPFASKEFSSKVYDKFVTIYSVVILLSLLSYIGAQLGYISPIGQIVVEQHDRAYTVYPFLVLDKGFDFLRFYGPFNEPGVVGTLGAVLLCTQRFNYRDWRTFIILISGVMSMSLFFYGLVIGYGLIYFVLVKRKYFAALLLLLAFSGFYLKTKDDPIMYNTLWQRFEWDKTEHQFKGDNRKNDAVDKFYDELKTKPAFWLGSSRAEIERFWNLVEETSSYKVIVLNSGMIFLILYLSFFILMAKNCKTNNKTFLLFVLVLIANTYQRPDVYSVVMIFIYSYFARFGLIAFYNRQRQLTQ